MKFCWTTINVKNMEESLSFYQEVAGLALNRRLNPIPGTEIAFLSSGEGETEVELIRNAKNNEPRFGRDISLGFFVDSLDAKIKELDKRGITEIEGPFSPNPMIRFLFITDPNGVRIQFVENTQ